MLMPQEEIGCFLVNNTYDTKISLHGCIIFSIINAIQNINLMIMCCIQSNISIMISTIMLVVVSIISSVLIWIIYFEHYNKQINSKLFFIIIGVVLMVQLTLTFLNKIFIVQYEKITNIYMYIAYSYEFFTMIIIYTIMENTMYEIALTIVVMYLFLLISLPAIQKHDQNDQDDQYFIILSALMLFPTLVAITAPSIHIFYAQNN